MEHEHEMEHEMEHGMEHEMEGAVLGGARLRITRYSVDAFVTVV
jgi:hypothetical protein